jgi:hypothetical protein
LVNIKIFASLSQLANDALAQVRCAMLNSHDHTLLGALRWMIDAVTRWPRN